MREMETAERNPGELVRLTLIKNWRKRRKGQTVTVDGLRAQKLIGDKIAVEKKGARS